ncbi:MarR family transcriptional regulator [Acuticoccus sp. M5D2P5]|uniref:MarR family winged helix-turn-helix transcriptional regulator n=1 Tax=Acuticoccus kalidii TaxID=2910977 RepID=UPI001F3819ED|nr:MarR family transcriptional regulator [Acuticoccus kalidii]MCF3932859.1 MarR family transcriptional regulator [Acuticoccus kalidii]
MKGPDIVAAEPVDPVETHDALDLEAFAPYLINRISARYNADMAEALKARGITTPQMRALAVLSVHADITVNELAVYAVMEQSTMSRTLDALESAGLVSRKARVGDARVREVALTAAGEAAFESVLPTMREAEEAMLAGIGRAERDAFLAALHTILRNIRRNPF